MVDLERIRKEIEYHQRIIYEQIEKLRKNAKELSIKFVNNVDSIKEFIAYINRYSNIIEISNISNFEEKERLEKFINNVCSDPLLPDYFCDEAVEAVYLYFRKYSKEEICEEDGMECYLI